MAHFKYAPVSLENSDETASEHSSEPNFTLSEEFGSLAPNSVGSGAELSESSSEPNLHTGNLAHFNHYPDSLENKDETIAEGSSEPNFSNTRKFGSLAPNDISNSILNESESSPDGVEVPQDDAHSLKTICD